MPANERRDLIRRLKFKISNRFAALENLNGNEAINRALENIDGNNATST